MLCFFGPASGLGNLQAHEFEVGHVERSASFVVRDRTVFIEYAVGCNIETMKAMLNEWRAGGTTSEPTSNNKIDSKVDSDQVASTYQSDAETDSAALTSHQNGVARVKNEPKITPAETSQKPTALTPAELKIENEFRSAVLAKIAEQLQITCNGERVHIRPVSVELSPRHHVNALAKLEFGLSADEKIHLIIKDELFDDKNGAVKYALKPKKSALLLRSNVAPILIRAERIELNGLSPVVRSEKTTIECDLSFMSGRESGK